MLLSYCAVSHLLTDALCAATLFGQMSGRADFFMILIVYNTLAFSTQAIVGLMADRRPALQPWCAGGAMALLALGFFLPLPAYPKTVLIGLCNSVFHVAGGVLILLRSGGKAKKLGVFVAPGAIGLTLGTLFPAYGVWFAAAILAAAALLIPIARREAPLTIEQTPEPEKPLLPVLLLTFAVAVRAIGGGAVLFPWKSGAALTMLLTSFVFLGKCAGGFLCDAIGPKRSAAVSILPAIPLILFCAAWIVPSLFGQFAINLTMPVTLWLLYLEMPRSPGFAFGLAASALWPGTLAGGILKLEGLLQQLVVGLCFLFALFAIVFAVHHLRKNGKERSL